MFVVAGSNLFGQWFSKEVIFQNFKTISYSGKGYFDLSKARIICVAWSFNIFQIENMYIISGAWRGKEKELNLIPLPEDCTESSKLLITCNDYIIIIVDVNLKTSWILDLKTQCFKKVTFTETPTVNEPNKSDEIVKVLTTNNTCSYLTSSGNVYVGFLPGYFDTSHVMGKVCDVQCGYEHYVLLSDDGRVYTWGNGRRLQLGHGDINNLESPTEVEALSGIKIIKIRAGGWHTMALSEFGDLYIWGWNDTGQLGIKRNFKNKRNEDVNTDFGIPTLVNIFDDNEKEVELNIKDINCGSRHSVVLLEDNSIWTTGNNKYGQLGLPIDEYPMLDYFKKAYVTMDDALIICGPWCTVVHN